MKRIFQSIALLSILLLPSVVFAQKAKSTSAGVINKKAISLPAPPFPPAARAVRATGVVNVEVTVDETGKVISAKAVSGHPLLRKASEDAAMKAEFEPFKIKGKPVRTNGILVYNYVEGNNSGKADTANQESAKKTEDAKDESAGKEEKSYSIQLGGAGSTSSSSEKSNPSGGQTLEGRYQNVRFPLNYYTFHSDGTFVKSSAGGSADSAYGTELFGTYVIQGNTITLKFNKGNVDQFPFEMLDNKDLKINNLLFAFRDN